MKGLDNYLKLSVTVITVLVLVSCENEKEDTDKAYVGKWQSGVYESMSLQGQPVAEQMTFTFTNTSFTDQIYQGADTNSLKFTSAIKGSISGSTDSEMDVEINELSVVEGIFIRKESDETAFLTTWNATLGKMLFETFTAEYIVNGDKMQLIIPVKYEGKTVKDTLNLNKLK